MKSQIKNEKVLSRTSAPKNIIVAPLFSLLANGTVYPPNVVTSSYKYSWAIVQKYFEDRLNKETLPMHAYCEYLNDDYVVYFGAPLTFRSWFLEDLAKMKLIPYDYKNSILIVCQDDWRLEPIDKRMLRCVCHLAITPIMKIYNIPKEKVVHLDSILVPDAYDKAQENDDLLKRYNLEKSVYYDPVWFQVILKDYIK